MYYKAGVSLSWVLAPNYQHCRLRDWHLVGSLFVWDLQQMQVDASIRFADGWEFNEPFLARFSHISDLLHMRKHLGVCVRYRVSHVYFIVAMFKFEVKRHRIVGFSKEQLKQRLRPSLTSEISRDLRFVWIHLVNFFVIRWDFIIYIETSMEPPDPFGLVQFEAPEAWSHSLYTKMKLAIFPMNKRC